MGKYHEPRGVLYYCYFDNAVVARRALALADTPTFPDIRKTIMHDDKVMSLIAAVGVDSEKGLLRGYADELGKVAEEPLVLKWGDWHCGEGKSLCIGVEPTFTEPSLVEPFVHGESHRILIVGGHVWQLRYDSLEWRKNVNSEITRVDVDSDLSERSCKIARGLGLDVVGIDYILNDEGASLLEVNAYPGLDQVKEAEDAFIGMAISWARSLR